MHRNVYGKDDHALVRCSWSWKLRTPREQNGVDWSALSARDPPVTNAPDSAPAIMDMPAEHGPGHNASGDLDLCEIRESSIVGAGLGLFATAFIKSGSRITKYSGVPITKEEAAASKSSYLLYVNNNCVLDASDKGHMAGRYANDATQAGRPVNARFGSSLRFYTCKHTGRKYKSIFAAKDIHPGEEILPDYGDCVTWHFPSEDESATVPISATVPSNHDTVRHNPCTGCGLPSSEGKRPGCAHSPGSVWGGDVARVSDTEGYPPAEAGKNITKSSDSENESSGDGTDDSREVAESTNPLDLIACPRCGHRFCGRNEWLSHHVPSLRCGYTITPAGTRYCCECGDYYRPATQHARATTNEGVVQGSPTTVSQMGFPPPPPPPPSDPESDLNDSNFATPLLVPIEFSDDEGPNADETDTDSDSSTDTDSDDSYDQSSDR